MISFDEGFARIRNLARPLGCEKIGLAEALGRVLREDLQAGRPHPAADISAMDGFAVAGDAGRYRLIGEIAAGELPGRALQDGEAVQIFTGALLPEGADRILIVENAVVEGGEVIANILPEQGQHLRLAGSDFDAGFALPAPMRLGPSEIALMGAMNFGELVVGKKPKVVLITTGSELVKPGDATKPNETIASNAYGLKALAEELGAEAEIAPIISDDLESIRAVIAECQSDLVVTTGGASVGKYDYTKEAAKGAGFALDVHKIALRPGKPIMAGTRQNQVFLGLPGNPISAMICAHIFMRVLIERFLGLAGEMPKQYLAISQEDLEENGERLHLMRAVVNMEENGFVARALRNQDSAAISSLMRSDALILREPFAPALKKGGLVPFIRTKPLVS